MLRALILTLVLAAAGCSSCPPSYALKSGCTYEPVPGYRNCDAFPGLCTTDTDCEERFGGAP